MKKSVLALAVLGSFVGAASAQSSVTLYGRLETALVYQKPDNGDAKYLLGGNAPIGGSRWGMRGTEDLGGGLRANFVLESGFNVDTGAAGNSSKLFDRQAYIGLASVSLGEIRLGRQNGMTREMNLFAGNVEAEGELNVVETVSGRPLYQNFGTRVDNAVTYVSPNFSGFQFRALVAAGEGAPTARQQGVLLSYGAGPLKAGLSYEEYSGSDTYNKVFTIGANYNFGVATVALGYQDTKDFGTQTAFTPGTDHNAYNVGVLVPFGAFEFRAQYTHSTVEAATDTDTDKYGLSLRYNLSKRTVVYAVATERGGDTFSSATQKKTEVAFGLAHTF